MRAPFRFLATGSQRSAPGLLPSEMHNVIRFPLSSVATGLLLASSLAACTTIENTVVG